MKISIISLFCICMLFQIEQHWTLIKNWIKNCLIIINLPQQNFKFYLLYLVDELKDLKSKVISVEREQSKLAEWCDERGRWTTCRAKRNKRYVCGCWTLNNTRCANIEIQGLPRTIDCFQTYSCCNWFELTWWCLNSASPDTILKEACSPTAQRAVCVQECKGRVVISS